MPDAFVLSVFSGLFNTDVAQDLAEPVVYVLHEKSFLGSLWGMGRVRREAIPDRSDDATDCAGSSDGGRREEGVGYATSPIGGQVNSVDMSVLKIWVMSVTSNRVLIEEWASYEVGASPVKGINR